MYLDSVGTVNSIRSMDSAGKKVDSTDYAEHLGYLNVKQKV